MIIIEKLAAYTHLVDKFIKVCCYKFHALIHSLLPAIASKDAYVIDCTH